MAINTGYRNFKTKYLSKMCIINRDFFHHGYGIAKYEELLHKFTNYQLL